MPVTGAQVRMARAALNWTVRDLAEATSLHRNTITNIETGKYVGDEASLATIETVLNWAGVEFIDENGGGPGVRSAEAEVGGPSPGSGQTQRLKAIVSNLAKYSERGRTGISGMNRLSQSIEGSMPV